MSDTPNSLVLKSPSDVELVRKFVARRDAEMEKRVMAATAKIFDNHDKYVRSLQNRIRHLENVVRGKPIGELTTVTKHAADGRVAEFFKTPVYDEDNN